MEMNGPIMLDVFLSWPDLSDLDLGLHTCTLLLVTRLETLALSKVMEHGTYKFDHQIDGIEL